MRGRQASFCDIVFSLYGSRIAFSFACFSVPLKTKRRVKTCLVVANGVLWPSCAHSLWDLSDMGKIHLDPSSNPEHGVIFSR